LYVAAIATATNPGSTTPGQQLDDAAMTLLLALAVAGVTAWVIEWSQRQCDNWCKEGDTDL